MLNARSIDSTQMLSFEEKKLDILPKSQSFRIKYIFWYKWKKRKKQYETIRWILSLLTSVCNSEMNETKRSKFRAIHKRICTTLERDNWFIRNAQILRDTSFSFGVRSLFTANNAASAHHIRVTPEVAIVIFISFIYRHHFATKTHTHRATYMNEPYMCLTFKLC